MSNRSGSIFTELGLAADCRAIGIDYPRELLLALEGSRPGQTVAAIYCWQALRLFLSFSRRDQGLAGDCLAESHRDHEQVRQTLLDDIDASLSLMRRRCHDQSGSDHWTAVCSELLEQAASGAERMQALSKGARRLSPLRVPGQLLLPTERFELTVRGMRADKIRTVEEIIYWLQMAAWAMACADTGGRRYLAAVTPRMMIERPCPPGMTDRLLLRLGANRVPLFEATELAPELPVSWRRLFWPDAMPGLAADLAQIGPQGRGLVTRQLTTALGNAVESASYRFRLGDKVRGLLRSGQDPARIGEATDAIAVLIYTPMGMMIGSIYLQRQEPIRPVLHIPVVESCPDYTSNIQAIQMIQDLQALMTIALAERPNQ